MAGGIGVERCAEGESMSTSDLAQYVGKRIRWSDYWGVWEGDVLGAEKNLLKVRTLSDEAWHYAPDMQDITIIEGAA